MKPAIHLRPALKADAHPAERLAPLSAHGPAAALPGLENGSSYRGARENRHSAAIDRDRERSDIHGETGSTHFICMPSGRASRVKIAYNFVYHTKLPLATNGRHGSDDDLKELRYSSNLIGHGKIRLRWRRSDYPCHWLGPGISTGSTPNDVMCIAEVTTGQPLSITNLFDLVAASDVVSSKLQPSLDTTSLLTELLQINAPFIMLIPREACRD